VGVVPDGEIVKGPTPQRGIERLRGGGIGRLEVGPTRRAGGVFGACGHGVLLYERSCRSRKLALLRALLPAAEAETGAVAAGAEVTFTHPWRVVHEVRDAVLQILLQLGRLVRREVLVLDR